MGDLHIQSNHQIESIGINVTPRSAGKMGMYEKSPKDMHKQTFINEQKRFAYNRKNSVGFYLRPEHGLPQVDEDPLDHSQFRDNESPNPDLSTLAVRRPSSLEIPSDRFDLGDTPSNAFDELEEIKESVHDSVSHKPQNLVHTPNISSDAPIVKSFKYPKDSSQVS